MFYDYLGGRVYPYTNPQSIYCQSSRKLRLTMRLLSIPKLGFCSVIHSLDEQRELRAEHSGIFKSYLLLSDRDTNRERTRGARRVVPKMPAWQMDSFPRDGGLRSLEHPLRSYTHPTYIGRIANVLVSLAAGHPSNTDEQSQLLAQCVWVSFACNFCEYGMALEKACGSCCLFRSPSYFCFLPTGAKVGDALCQNPSIFTAHNFLLSNQFESSTYFNGFRSLTLISSSC